ncbi:MAG: serine/threonine protein kinase [Tepidisphaera sp.]
MPLAPALAEHLASCVRCRGILETLDSDDRFTRRFAMMMRPESAARQADDQAPPEVPGYTIESELARGGQGVVYRAVQHETHRPVALKAILRGVLASQREIARFEREVEIAASLRHPNIVTVFEARLLPDGRHVLAMDLVEGVPLSTWAAGVPKDLAGLRTRLTLIRDTARAVQYAHSKGVIHRDLKPGNILVEHATHSPKILDFGLARSSFETDPAALSPKPATKDPTMLGGLTMIGVFQGTPAYAAPEQFDGEPGRIDVRTDVYALGVMLHELLTGQCPFADSKDQFTLIASTKRMKMLPEPSAVAKADGPAGISGIGHDIDAVVARATAPARDQRYPTAAAFADDLDALLVGEAVSARKGRGYRASKFARRHRLILIALSIVIFASAGGILALVSTKVAREREQFERARSRTEGAKAQAIAQILHELIPLHETNHTDRQSEQRIILDRLNNTLGSGAFAAQDEVLVALHTMLSQIYADRREFGFSHVNLSRALLLTKKAFGDEHPETATVLALYADVLIQRGSFPEALGHANESLRIRAMYFANDEEPVIASRCLLARVHLASGRIAEAAVEAEAAARLIDTKGSTLGTVLHAQILRTLSEVRAKQDDPLQARKLSMQSIEVLLKLLPDEDPEITRGLRSLATVDPSRPDLEALADAISTSRPTSRPTDVWTRWIAFKTELLGKDSERVAQSYRTMGNVLRDRLELRPALAAFDNAIDIYTRTRGDTSLAVLECLTDKYLVSIYATTGPREEPLQVAKRRLHIARNLKEPIEDVSIASIWREYAHEPIFNGRLDEAEVELRAAAAFARDRLISGIECSRCPLILAQQRYYKGDIAEALLAQQSYDEAFAADPKHYEMPWKRIVLGCCLAANGDLDRAEQFISAEHAWIFLLSWGRIGEAVPHMIRDTAARFRAAGREAPALILEEALAAIDPRPRTLDAPLPLQDFARPMPPGTPKGAGGRGVPQP